MSRLCHSIVCSNSTQQQYHLFLSCCSSPASLSSFVAWEGSVPLYPTVNISRTDPTKIFDKDYFFYLFTDYVFPHPKKNCSFLRVDLTRLYLFVCRILSSPFGGMVQLSGPNLSKHKLSTNFCEFFHNVWGEGDGKERKGAWHQISSKNTNLRATFERVADFGHCRFNRPLSSWILCLLVLNSFKSF